MKVQNQFPLKALNTFGVESYAKAFMCVENQQDVQAAIQYAQNFHLNIQVLGGGSNVVLPKQVDQLVIQFVGRSYSVLDESQDSVLVRVDAGYNWHEWVMCSLAQDWYGLQNLAYIPGHVGAAPVQNIGAYGVEVKDLIENVYGIYLENGQTFTLTNDECQFAYRESIFKHELDGKVLITHVDFRLSKVAEVNVAYAPLDQMAADMGNPTPQQLASWVIEVRQSKLPDPNVLPNAGSFFKNPVLSKEQFTQLQSRFPDMPYYQQADGIKVPAGWLIDQLGLKGEYFGSVRVHEKQALVLVNHGGTGDDVLKAAQTIKGKVLAQYGIELEQEPRIIK